MSTAAAPFTVLIPARLASTRLPNKPLADIAPEPEPAEPLPLTVVSLGLEQPPVLSAAALDARASLEAWHDMADAFAWQDSAGRLGPCLEQLEPVRRNCILHAYVDGLSHGEIARRLEAPLGTVKAWIKRSLAALRECMG